MSNWKQWVSAGCLVAMLVAVVAASYSDRTAKPMAINGDSLGPDTGESLDEYAPSRSSHSLTPSSTVMPANC